MIHINDYTSSTANLIDEELRKTEDAFTERIEELNLRLEDKDSVINSQLAIIEDLKDKLRLTDMVIQEQKLTIEELQKKLESQETMAEEMDTACPLDDLDLESRPSNRAFCRPSLAYAIAERKKSKMTVRDMTKAFSSPARR